MLVKSALSLFAMTSLLHSFTRSVVNLIGCFKPDIFVSGKLYVRDKFNCLQDLKTVIMAH